MERIDLADFLLIAEAATGFPIDQIKQQTDLALADAALQAPFAGVADAELHPTTAEKIAVLGYRIARYHPLRFDGNKRTAWVAMRHTASSAGLTWTDPGEDEVGDVMEAAASGEMSEPDFVTWVAQRLG
jgi:prophage maintenance system killer protein